MIKIILHLLFFYSLIPISVTAQYLKHPELLSVGRSLGTALGIDLMTEKLNGQAKSCRISYGKTATPYDDPELWDEKKYGHEFYIEWDELGRITRSNMVHGHHRQVPFNHKPEEFVFGYNSEGLLCRAVGATNEYYIFYKDGCLSQVIHNDLDAEWRSERITRQYTDSSRIDNSNKSGPFHTIYDKNGHVKKQILYSHLSGKIEFSYCCDSLGRLVYFPFSSDLSTVCYYWFYTWNEQGEIDSYGLRSVKTGEVDEETFKKYIFENEVFHYSYIYDEYGNWIVRDATRNGVSGWNRTVRTIEYY